jgi:hypothetical protein
MEEWKVRQEIYHRLHSEFDDDLNTKHIELSKDIVKDALRYFSERDIGWIYPSKSYMVAICYARWLAKEFGGRPLQYLDDESLLFGNDPYFVTYSNDPKTYNSILNNIGWDFDETKGMVPDVRSYFIEEFMINDYQ